MVMTSEAAHSRMQLRVTALESGWPGQVIRCRSSLTGLVFRGRILDAHTVAMLGREGSGLW
jgi:flagella basal body P-ring formation protein FlgA